MGNSGGGWIVAGVGMMMAERDESDKVRFQLQISPMTGNQFLKPVDKSWPRIEQINRRIHYPMYTELMTPALVDKDVPLRKNRWIFPNEMGVHLAKKVPPVVIMTSEYDYYRGMSHEAARLYKKAGTLLDFVEYAGKWNAHFYTNNGEYDVFYKDFRRLVDKYLK